MKIIRKSILLLLLSLVFSCEQPRNNFDKGIIPLEVINLSEVNTEFDDYNPAVIYERISDYFTLIFSTNRNSNGDNFDFVCYRCYISSSLITGDFLFEMHPEICYFLDSINSTSNELGPYFPYDIYDYPPYEESDTPDTPDMRFFYASDIKGNLDLYHSRYDFYHGQLIPVIKASPLLSLNTKYDEGYLCIHPDESPARETVYFTSNRDSVFNIYSATGNLAELINESDTAYISIVDALSSDKNDKCPYIANDIMVFTSDREGGYGGFDLYYSRYNGEKWSAPVNFGRKVNSAYDEYRPVYFDADDNAFYNDMLLFSSNRPGGKGGFDLYMVGLFPGLFQ